MVTEAYVYDAVRTPRGKGKQDGSLHEVKPVNLISNLLVHLQQTHDLDTSRVDDVVLGCVSPLGDQGGDIAKTAVMTAKWDEKVAGVQLNRFCASGLEAVNMAAMKIRSGWEQLVVAGGVESMSRVPMGSDGGAWAMDPATNFATGFMPQGIGADLVATIEGFSRQDVDNFALNSQKKAAAARQNGHFSRSIVPVKDQNGLTILDHDEFIRPNTTIEGLGKLNPSFQFIGEMAFNSVAERRYHSVEKINHVHTPGNSSGIVDGAAAVLIGSAQIGKDLQLTPRARIVACAVTSTDPTIMLIGPGPATQKALKLAGMKAEDIDLFEVNEAFAAVVMRFQKDLNVPFEKINVNGGAIAMGHPLGATGAMLISTVIDELERRKLRFGLCTLCVGGGMGIATIVERI